MLNAKVKLLDVFPDSETGDPFWPVKNWPVIFRPVKFGQLFYAN